ncbi:hypothetical protein [Trinickia mobilis]|uniref:hypothetical protein n=1 Tax=Trinickia mobilis TaxID=2816356 RepID=UPI001A8D7F52|nr:hypothetical protein [Trinickia mobilis]
MPEHVAVCPQCGANVLLEVLPAAELVPPPALLPARILRPRPTTIDQTGTILTAPPRLAPGDLNGARRWGMSRGAAILLFGFAIAFGTYVSITQRDVALVKWQKVLYRNEPGALPAGIANNLPPPPTSVPLVALLEREIEKSRAEDAKDEQIVQNELTKANAAAAKKGAAATAPAAPVAPPHPAKPKAAAVASAAPARERASEPRKTETVVQKPADKPIQKPAEKPVVAAVERTAGPAVEKTEAPKAQQRATIASQPGGDAIQRAAQACDKQDSAGCIRRQLVRTEGIDRVDKSEQSGAIEAGGAEPKAAARERLTREPVRPVATAIAPTPVAAARKVATPDLAASVVRGSAAGPAGESPQAKAPLAPVQRLAATAATEDFNRLYRGH